ncbi:MAG: LacI family DNA-binding transcriptional regulator [Flavihumibacter sp.]
MEKKVSIKDIAKKLGVSAALVSYVLNNKEKEARVGLEMAERVRSTARELNYQPNLIARSLRSGRTKTIGLIVADISNPFFSNIARTIEDEASLNNYTVIFGSSDENAEKSQTLINTLIKRQVDGLIIAPAENTAPQLQVLSDRGFPYVLIDRYFNDLNANTVRIDNYQASFKAVKHLHGRGYRRIAMVAYKTRLPHMEDRKQGFLKALESLGLPVHENSLMESSYENIGSDVAAIMQRLLDQADHRPDSFLFATNSLAINGLKEINKRKLKVPDDLGIISFDETEAFDFFYCPLTYINQSTDRIGKEAVRILMQQLEVKDKNTTEKMDTAHLVIDAKLVVQHSCGE